MRKLLFAIFLIFFLGSFSHLWSETGEVKIALFFSHIDRKTVNRYDVSEFFPLGTVEKYSIEGEKRERLLLEYLDEKLKACKIYPTYYIYKVGRFSKNKRKYMKLEDIISSISAQNIKFVVDGRYIPEISREYKKINRKLDSLLYGTDILFMVPTGDLACDSDEDGRIDTDSLSGEFVKCKNVVSIGGSENYLPVDSNMKKYDWFKSEPFRDDLIADSFNGMAVFSGRGKKGGYAPTLVSDCTAISVENSPPIHFGTIFSVVNTLVAAIKIKNYYTKRGFPYPPSLLIRSTLISLTKDCNPGQYGTGKYREINGRPDENQGFGKLPQKLNWDNYELKYVDCRDGIENYRCKKLVFSADKKSSRVVVVLSYTKLPEDNGKVTLKVLRSDKREYLPITNSNRTDMMVELTPIHGFTYSVEVIPKGKRGRKIPFSIVVLKKKL